MAVFFNLDKEAVLATLGRYSDIYNNLVLIKPIEEGSENSNYFVHFKKAGVVDKCVLTIFGPRTNQYNVNFYIQVQNLLNKNNIPSPYILKADNQSSFGYIDGKPFLIASFLHGVSKSINEITEGDCFEFGAMLARFHLLASSEIEDVIENTFWIFKFKDIFRQCVDLGLDGWELNYFQNELNKINFKQISSKQSAGDLPFGIIHADPFPDNVFFDNDKISGFFDFYFSCSGYLIYDVAIAMLAWCFDSGNNIIADRINAISKGYQSVRSFTKTENLLLPYFIDIASLRFYSTRMLDRLTSRIDVSKKAKDPNDFRLRKIFLQDHIKPNFI
jgi:homoserine kinase type II